MVHLLKQSGLSGNMFDMVVRREEEFLLRDALKRMSKLTFKASDRSYVHVQCTKEYPCSLLYNCGKHLREKTSIDRLGSEYFAEKTFMDVS